MMVQTDQIKVVLLEDEDLLRGLLGDWLSSQPDIELLDSFRAIAIIMNIANLFISLAIFRERYNYVKNKIQFATNMAFNCFLEFRSFRILFSNT